MRSKLEDTTSEKRPRTLRFFFLFLFFFRLDRHEDFYPRLAPLTGRKKKVSVGSSKRPYLTYTLWWFRRSFTPTVLSETKLFTALLLCHIDRGRAPQVNITTTSWLVHCTLLVLVLVLFILPRGTAVWFHDTTNTGHSCWVQGDKTQSYNLNECCCNL